ncbi:TPA: hypothetical protein ACK0CK_002748 [Staphylococcus aureus]
MKDIYGIISNVRKVLNSGTPLSEISRDTGVSISVLKKLKSEYQDVEDTKFSTIWKLNSYYKNHQITIDGLSETNRELDNVKLPKKIVNFIRRLRVLTEEINEGKQELNVEVSKVWRKDKDDVSFLGHQLNVRQGAVLGLKDGVLLGYELYSLKVTKPIENHIENIDSVKVLFDEAGLVKTLKEIKLKGGQIILEKNDILGTFISVRCKHKDVVKYSMYNYYGKMEADFFDIEVK